MGLEGGKYGLEGCKYVGLEGGEYGARRGK